MSERRRRGFTLLELLVATVLGALLMAALATTLRVTLAESKRVEESRSAQTAVRPFVQQLRRDIVNADSFALSPGGMVLAGAIHRDLVTHQSTQRLATVRYVVTSVSGTRVLLRIQKSGRPEQPLGEVASEIVWIGVGKFLASADVVGLFGNGGDELLADGELDVQVDGSVRFQVDASQGLVAMPPTLDVALTDSDNRVVLAQSFHHHWDES